MVDSVEPRGRRRRGTVGVQHDKMSNMLKMVICGQVDTGSAGRFNGEQCWGVEETEIVIEMER